MTRARVAIAVGLAAVVAGCGGGSGDDGADDGDDVADDAPPPDAVELIPGSLDVTWMHGQPDCDGSLDPAVQVHQYNPTTFILRQDKCRTFEAPFVYLLIGQDSAFLLDSGATGGPELRDAVLELIGDRALTVAHSHAHGDHTAGDAQFQLLDNAIVVGHSQTTLQATFAIIQWPYDPGIYELGGRTLDVLAIPGHEATHLAVYDRQTGLLLTGDSLYPGFLFVASWSAYRESMHRLRQFADARPITAVLGAHVEMTSTPGVAYPYGTTYQPEEHELPLGLSELDELDDALIAIGSEPAMQVHDDFIIDPQ